MIRKSNVAKGLVCYYSKALILYYWDDALFMHDLLAILKLTLVLVHHNLKD